MPPKKEKETAAKEAAKEAAKAAPDSYELHAKVLCQHLDNLYYEAKIINVEHSDEGEPIYTVHYQGWNQRHDEKIPHSSTRERFLEYTPANVERAKAEMKDAQARLAQSRGRKRKSNLLDEKRSGGADSRGSTPSDKRGASSSRAASIASDKAPMRKRKSGPAPPAETDTVPDVIQKNEIKIEVPGVLKDILVDDHDMINRQMYLSRLPPRYTVDDIVHQYADYMGTCAEAKESLTFEYGGDDTQLNTMIVTLIESSYGVKDYFDSVLGTMLLYKFERPQYADLLASQKAKQEATKDSKKKTKNDMAAAGDAVESEAKFNPSEHYGFVHLLRLFVRFPRMLALTNWSERTKLSIISHVENFLKFLEVNRHKFFDLETDYEVAPPEYQRRVWSS